MDLRAEIRRVPMLADVCAAQETVWINPNRSKLPKGWPERTPWPDGLTIADVRDAEERLKRFAPLICRLFPETEASGGIIESELKPIPRMGLGLNEGDRLLLKLDSHLPVAGSVKARGGIYEVLCHTERLALEAGLLHAGDSYERLAEPECRAFFARHTVQVGSTGNLGMSIGIMSAALGYHAIVHMSHDAKQWKKDKLRACGVEVREYASDYSLAVQEGRRLSQADPTSYFVDDENSRELFLGYAVAGLRLKEQLTALHMEVDEAHPLLVHIPCGVGGAPGGIAFGLRCVFGNDVHVFFAEPTQAPCMLCGMATGLDSAVCVQDFGLTGRTEADGLAVGRPSGFVGKVMRPHISGIFTASDETMLRDMKRLYDAEGIFLEPSACAGFAGVEALQKNPAARAYLQEKCNAGNAVQIVWATGGGMVPKAVQEEYLRRAGAR